MMHGPDSFYEESIIRRRHAARRNSYQQKAQEMLTNVKQPPHDAAIRSLEDKSLPKLAEIHQAISLVLPVSVEELIGPSRKGRIIVARLIYYRLAHELSGHTLGVIGQHCGGRDHSTVNNGLGRAHQLEATLAPAIAAVRKALGVGE